MSDHLEHHFVPQFYFRNFSSDGRRINLLHLASERTILGAKIRGQAKRRRFYFTAELEKVFSGLEGRQSHAIRQVVQGACDNNPRLFLNESIVPSLWNAVLFQRFRTPREGEITAPTAEHVALQAFRAHVAADVESEFRDQILEAIDNGTARVTMDRRAATALGISVAFESSPLISDLAIHVLRNQTDYPFIFSDAPVIFLNQYYRDVEHRGVLGLQTPGLQIFFPLSPHVVLMLVDADVYGGRYRVGPFVDLYNRSDVSCINSLQVHQAKEAIYFGADDDVEYVDALWRIHGRARRDPRMKPREYFRVDGPDKLFHTFESHLNVCPDFSFLTCSPVASEEYEFRYRSPEIVEEHDEIVGRKRRASGAATTPVLYRAKDGRQFILDHDAPGADAGSDEPTAE